MKYLILLTVLSISLVTVSCDETSDIFDGNGGGGVDPLIDEEVVEARNYNLTTPVYGMQVSVREDVGLSDNNILNILDNRATEFLNCQFEGGADLGFQDVMLSNGSTIGPLSELRVFVVPRRFECQAADRNRCTGIYFFDIDIIVVSSSSSFAGCPNLAIWKHELGHRYGMEADHSNINEFRACTETENCSFEDILSLSGIEID